MDATIYVVDLRPLVRSRPTGALMDRVLPGDPA